MDILLTDSEARVLGCLLEKEMATPDYYPLTLNSLLSACNQKSNRNPVVSYDEETVRHALAELQANRMVRQSNVSRVPKYEQVFSDGLKLVPREKAILCVLLLRGPQTPGQLRTHTHRLCEFSDADHVEETLKQLTERPDGPFVSKLPREPGKRESRFTHLFVDLDEAIPVSEDPEPVAPRSETPDRDPLQDLERRVTALEQQLAALQARIPGPDGH